MNCKCEKVTLTDRDRMEDMLAGEKYLIDGYSTFIPETGSEELRGIFTGNMAECARDQLTVFDAMAQRGWYETKSAPTAEVNTVRMRFADLQNKLQ